MFLQRIIEGHDNVESFNRSADIVFNITRIKQGDNVQIVCVDEYVLSESMARQIASDFPDTNVIFVGGKWNHTSGPATSFCNSRGISIHNAGTINAGLHKTRY